MKTTILGLVSLAFLATSVLKLGSAYAQSGSTSSSIPSAGSDVKQGDFILWSANRNILQKVADSVSQTVPADDAAAAAAQAAAQVKTAAHSAAETAAAKVASPTATATDIAKFQAASAAATQADAATPAAAGPAAALKSASSASVNAALAKIIDDAKSKVDAAAAEKAAAHTKADLDSANAAAAATAAAKPGALAAAGAKAAMLKDEAANSAKEVQAADGKWEQATMFYDAAIKALSAPAPKAAAIYCAPSGSRFMVTAISPASTAAAASTTTSGNGKADSATSVSKADTQIIEGVYPDKLQPLHFKAIPQYKGGDQPPQSPCGPGTQIAEYGQLYQFTGAQIKDSAFIREGFTWGGLVVPFKYYFKDKSIKTNSSVVGFAGYEGWLPGVSLAAVVAAGVGASSQPSTMSSGTSPASSTSNTTTVATYTFGTGVIATFGGTVKAGLMFGRDYQGNPSAFPYENKTWMALSIGAGF